MASWKGRFVVVTSLLVVCCALIGFTVATLNDTRNQLKGLQVQLESTEIDLADIESQLTDAEESLHTAQRKLADTEAQLDESRNQLDAVTTQLKTTEDQLNTTSNQLKSAHAVNNRMLSQYSSLKAQIDARFGLTTQDVQSFITPDDPSVMSQVQEITGGYSEDAGEYWNDCGRLYGWVVRNIKYSYDSYIPVLPDSLSGELFWFRECWQMPEETLEVGKGDCEDMALLLATMLLSYNENKYPVWLLTISSIDPDSPSHMAVAFPVADDNLTIVDPAGNYYTGYPSGSLLSDPIPVAIDDWLSHWDREIPDAEIVQAFSYDFDEHFSGTDEFIAWTLE